MIKKCLECNIEFKTIDKRKKFCTRRCSAIFNNRGRTQGKATRDKIRNSLKKYNKEELGKIYKGDEIRYLLKCEFCKKDFVFDKKVRKYCSNKCRYSGMGKNRKNKLSYRTFQKILKRAFPDWKCPFCEWDKTFNTHHIRRKKDGGNEDTNNLVMLCPNHHSEAHLLDVNINKKISDEDLKKNSIGNYYTGQELLNKFYYGNTAKEFEKNK